MAINSFLIVPVALSFRCFTSLTFSHYMLHPVRFHVVREYLDGCANVVSGYVRQYCVVITVIACAVSYTINRFGQSLLKRIDSRSFHARGQYTRDLSLLNGNKHEARRRRQSEAPEYVASEPSKYAKIVIITIIGFRWEIFEWLSYVQRCSRPGVGSFIGLLLLAHHVFTADIQADDANEDDLDDPWRSIFDELRDWLSNGRIRLIGATVSSALFCTGMFLAVNQVTRSTYICLPGSDMPVLTVVWQLIALCLDAYVAIAAWRLLVWQDSLQTRIHMSITIASASAAVIATVGLLRAQSISEYLGFQGMTFPIILFDGIILSIMLVTLIIWTCDASPLLSVNIITIISGLATSSSHLVHVGDWMHLSTSETLLPFWLIIPAAISFVHFLGVKIFVCIRQASFTALFLIFLIVASVFAIIHHPPVYKERHPINDLMYDASHKYMRWHTDATTSITHETAVRTYKESHNGRLPPPGFADWFQFAVSSAVIDDFRQLDVDLEPFWLVSPKELRNRVDLAIEQPNIAKVTIVNGNASWAVTDANTATVATLDHLVSQINTFSQHLPDMTMPINLDRMPRVLPDAARQSNKAGVHQEMGSNSVRWAHRSACRRHGQPNPRPYYENPSHVCYDCVKGHSQLQLFNSHSWLQSLDLCSQPDLLDLHDFFITEQSHPIITQLLPVFSAAKTDMFNDILIPLVPPQASADSQAAFRDRSPELLWRSGMNLSALPTKALRGSHKSRLLHLLNEPGTRDTTTMITRTKQKDVQYKYEKMATSHASWLVPTNVKAWLPPQDGCQGLGCQNVPESWTAEPADITNPYATQHTLLLDETGGPSDLTLGAIAADTVPFISTIFRTWYTGRIWPWVHFVPVDPRYQGLHSTLAYFAGKGEVKPKDAPGQADAASIATQGSHWASKALDLKSQQIYLFRVLLEWARLVNDDRDRSA